MKHNKNKRNLTIYEKENVFGDENKIIDSDRFYKLLQLLKDLKTAPKNILDVGCGTGFLASVIKKIYPNSHVEGIDISSSAINIARKKYTDIKFVKTSAEEKLPYKNNYFDLVVSGENIEHIVDTDNYLLEINRVLKKSGTFFITTPNLASWFNRLMVLFGKQPYYLEPSLRQTFPIFSFLGKTFPDNLNSPPSGHLRLFTLDMLKKMLKFYGFEVLSQKGYIMLHKKILKEVDVILSNSPSLAMGLIVKARKIKNA